MKIKLPKDYIKTTWQKSIRNRFFLFFSIINLLIVMGLFVILYYMFGASKGELVVLHYNIYLGIDWIGSWQRVFYPGIIGFIIFLINFILGGFVYLKERVLTIFLTWTTFFCLIFLSISAFLIIYINS